VADHSARADRRDDRASNRDDAAVERDHDAAQRDHDADQRDAYADEDSLKLDDLFDRVRREVLHRFAGIEAATVDAALWTDLTPAALIRLQAGAAEQRRLAARGRLAITTLLDQLHTEVRYLRDERLAAAHDRRVSKRDRQHSAHDRQDSADDRVHAAQNRDQSAIERAQG